jgi:hypothetical protein
LQKSKTNQSLSVKEKEIIKTMKRLESFDFFLINVLGGEMTQTMYAHMKKLITKLMF